MRGRFDTARLAVAMFIASEAVFFGFLIAAYIYFTVRHGVPGANAGNSLDPGRTLIFTMCLVGSSGTMWMAERRLAASRRAEFRGWLCATILLGGAFISGQAVEYLGLIAKTVTPERSLFAAAFFTLTGFHGFHVLCGLVALGIVLILTFMRSFEARQISGVGAVAMYWHFVDMVWIVIFSLVYLTVWL